MRQGYHPAVQWQEFISNSASVVHYCVHSFSRALASRNRCSNSFSIFLGERRETRSVADGCLSGSAPRNGRSSRWKSIAGHWHARKYSVGAKKSVGDSLCLDFISSLASVQGASEQKPRGRFCGRHVSKKPRAPALPL